MDPGSKGRKHEAILLLGPGPSNCANDEESDQEMNGGGQFGELREDDVEEYGSKEYGC